MSRFATKLSLRAGLVLVNVLVTIPIGLHAQTVTPLSSNSTPNPVNSAVVDGNNQPATQSQVNSIPLSVPSPTSTGVQPAANNRPNPSAQQQPTTKPAISASNRQQPIEAVVNLTIKLNEKRVYVYKGDQLVTKYPIAIGKKGWETPTGEWQIMEKIKNPAWTSFKTGEVFAPGRENPLGARWIGFWTDGKDVVGFHGTPDLKSIGTAASHGCVRMRNRDVKALFRLVKVGTTVTVVDQ
jgi:lipoprotein-anchoring transpeptidase ErfK/SrfK